MENQIYRNMRREMMQRTRARRRLGTRMSYHRLMPLPTFDDLFRFRNQDRPLPPWMRNRNPLLRDTASPLVQSSTRPVFDLGQVRMSRMQDTILED